jgi:hypothetical protein
MRAAIFRQFGPPSVLEVVSDWPKPTRQAGEVLIRVVATSVNPIDWKCVLVVTGCDLALPIAPLRVRLLRHINRSPTSAETCWRGAGPARAASPRWP